MRYLIYHHAAFRDLQLTLSFLSLNTIKIPWTILAKLSSKRMLYNARQFNIKNASPLPFSFTQFLLVLNFLFPPRLETEMEISSPKTSGDFSDSIFVSPSQHWRVATTRGGRHRLGLKVSMLLFLSV